MRLRSSRPATLASICLAVLLVPGFGCSSTAYEREQARLTGLDAAMRSAAERLNAADIPAARTHLDEAEGLAESDYEVRRVESLRQVLVGAIALREGRGSDAADAWSRIPSPTLRYEVQEKAAGVGIQVPDEPAPSAG